MNSQLPYEILLRVKDDVYLNNDHEYLNKSEFKKLNILKQWEVIEMPNEFLKPTNSYKNWKDDISLEVKNPYFGRAYYNPNSKELIIGHRGSDEINDWIGANKDFAFTNWNQQFADATNFSDFAKQFINDKHPNHKYTTYQTGHSLGGGIAQISAAKSGDFAVSYDGPPVGEIIKNFIPNNFDNAINNSINFSSLPNFANNEIFDKHIGTVIRLVPDGTEKKTIDNPAYDPSFVPGVVNFDPLNNLINNQLSHRIEFINKQFDTKTGLPKNFIIERKKNKLFPEKNRVPESESLNNENIEGNKFHIGEFQKNQSNNQNETYSNIKNEFSRSEFVSKDLKMNFSNILQQINLNVKELKNNVN